MKKLINITAVAAIVLSTQATAGGAGNTLSNMIDPPSPSKESYMQAASGSMSGIEDGRDYSFVPAVPSKEAHMASGMGVAERRAVVGRSSYVDSYPMTPPAPSKEAPMIR